MIYNEWLTDRQSYGSYLLDAAVKEALYCSSLGLSTLAASSLSALLQQSQMLPRSRVCQSSLFSFVVEDAAAVFSGHGSPVDLFRLLLFRLLLADQRVMGLLTVATRVGQEAGS